MMTPVGPPKRAPKEIPPDAAHYLDNAAEYLSELAKDFGLDLKPYDQYSPAQSSWLHGMYGEANDREFCIQLVTDMKMAPNFTAILRGWIRLYPPGDRNEWFLLETHEVNGMAALVAGASCLTRRVRFACDHRMPHRTDPAPKA